MRPRALFAFFSFSACTVLSLPFVGCIQGGAGVTSFIRADGAALGLDIGTDTEATSGPSFEKLAIRMVSSAGDTLRDTLNESGRSLSRPPVTAFQVGTSIPPFHPVYEVPPLSAWKVDVEALVAGTVVGSGSATTERIPRGDTLRVAVALLPFP
jgi:hypothetical protein